EGPRFPPGQLRAGGLPGPPGAAGAEVPAGIRLRPGLVHHPGLAHLGGSTRRAQRALPAHRRRSWAALGCRPAARRRAAGHRRIPVVAAGSTNSSKDRPEYPGLRHGRVTAHRHHPGPAAPGRSGQSSHPLQETWCGPRAVRTDDRHHAAQHPLHRRHVRRRPGFRPGPRPGTQPPRADPASLHRLGGFCPPDGRGARRPRPGRSRGL
ncbi:Transmembrane component BioN of energizing module of biotin ECF transporter, partial [Arthrobacter sp. DR-2P]